MSMLWKNLPVPVPAERLLDFLVVIFLVILLLFHKNFFKFQVPTDFSPGRDPVLYENKVIDIR